MAIPAGQLRRVIVAPGLRIHAIPKVASASISFSAQDAKLRMAMPHEEGDEYRFAVIRHPLERLVSVWSYFCDGELPTRDQLTALGYTKPMSFERFVEVVCERHADNQHTAAQCDFIGPHRIDMLWRLEHLGTAWEALRQRFSNLPLSELRHMHKTSHRRWQDYYTPELYWDAVRVYDRDLTLWNQAGERINGEEAQPQGH